MLSRNDLDCYALMLQRTIRHACSQPFCYGMKNLSPDGIGYAERTAQLPQQSAPPVGGERTGMQRDAAEFERARAVRT